MILMSIFVYAMGWLLPDTPNDREFMVWGDPYVNNMDKSLLVKEELLNDFTGDQVPLQSQLIVDWTALLIYSSPDEEEVTDLWTKEALISIREFEKLVKQEPLYKRTCEAEQAVSATNPVLLYNGVSYLLSKTSTDDDDVVCRPESFLSPLDLFQI